MPDYTETQSYQYATLRQAMAWDAMQAILEHQLKNPNFVLEFHMGFIAKHAVELANEMITELKRSAPKEDIDAQT